MHYSKQSAFTLLELSIVIVIIGLIVAGISAGQSLVKQANLRSVVSELGNFDVVLNSFRLQYDALPGDMSNAHSYWPNCGSGASASDCNGDNDGLVEWISSPPGSDTDRECHRFWQHLALSGLHDNTASGVGSDFTSANAIEGPLQSSLYYFEGDSGTANWTQDQSFVFSAYYNGNDWRGILSVTEAQGIDKKLDDGIANAGKLFAITGSSAASSNTCSAYFNQTPADYNLGSTVERACYLTYEN